MKVLRSLTVTLTLLVPSGTLVLAQGAGDHTPPPVSYSKGPCTVHEDNSLIFEGDMVFTCDYLPRLRDDPELPSARRALKAGAGLGPPPSSKNDALQNTGGIPLTGPIVALAPAAGVVLTGKRFRPPE